jgi:glycosyltransferase involved in cell wall biosynthesis
MLPAKVTVAIPTRNRAHYLRLSLASALAQTYENLEVVVSNNASTDDTAAVLNSIRDARVLVLHQPTLLSMVENWNACVAAATGDYFLMLSDDDLLEPEAIAAMVRVYEHGPIPTERIGLVYCRSRVIDESGNTVQVGPYAPAVETAEQLIVGFFNCERVTWACSILFRRSDIVAGYTPDLPLATDAAQWMRAAIRHGNVGFVDRLLANYRRHGNITATTSVDTWKKEHLALAEYAIKTFQASGNGSPAVYDEIRRAVRRFNVRMISPHLAQRFEGQKLKFLRAHGAYWRDFASLYGLEHMIRNMLHVCAPGFVLRVGRLRRRLSGN